MLHNKFFEIMKQFLGDYNKEVYGRGLIKKVNLSQKNIALTLDELEKKGIVLSALKGNTKYFSLNKKNPLCERYILLTEIENSIRFLEKNPKIKYLFESIENCQIICIFGSYAKGIQKNNSDLDVFIAGSRSKKIKFEGNDYGIEISARVVSKFNFVKSLKENNYLTNEIIKNHIILSGYEDFVKEVMKQKWKI